ncbi:MAG: DsrE family protein [Bacteroidales bacterium]|nr:DsrE family protein [Bacteroidales bacterium]
MKRVVLMIAVLSVLLGCNCENKEPNATEIATATKVGIVISSNDVETVWNVLRLANYSMQQGDSVSIFLLGKGVELDSLVTVETKLAEQTDKFLDNGGSILGCGTCLKSRNNNEPQFCTMSSMADLYALIKKNDKVLTF